MTKKASKPPAQAPVEDPVKGTYQHYKGAFFEVLGVAEAPETGQRLVVYQAIGLTETSRLDPVTGRVRPWPWTIDVEGEGQFFATRDDAIAAEWALSNEFHRADIRRDDDALAPIVAEVLARIDGRKPARELPLDVRGTAFQRRVWEELQRIPLGETRTYGEIAAAIDAPRASRAVGSACGANPVPVVVPCHRVLPASGGIGNYGLGPRRKQRLLEHEGAAPSDD